MNNREKRADTVLAQAVESGRLASVVAVAVSEDEVTSGSVWPDRFHLQHRERARAATVCQNAVAPDSNLDY